MAFSKVSDASASFLSYGIYHLDEAQCVVHHLPRVVSLYLARLQTGLCASLVLSTIRRAVSYNCHRPHQLILS